MFLYKKWSTHKLYKILFPSGKSMILLALNGEGKYTEQTKTWLYSCRLSLSDVLCLLADCCVVWRPVGDVGPDQRNSGSSQYPIFPP